METTPKFLDPRTLAKLDGLHLRAKHIVEGFVAGLHRSPYHGFSIEFAEHREYTAGDDLRYVDWKAFGRTDKYYLKQFDDETNLICYLVVDASESMQYRGPNSALSKFEFSQCLAAALAWLVLQQQDAVGLVTFDERVRSNIRPSSNPSQLRQVLTVLESTVPSSKTAGGRVFHELAQRMTKRGVVIVISDLFDNVDSLLAGLKHFRHRRHDVVVFHVLDQAELDFPFSKPSLFRGLEDLPDVVVDPAAFRKAYLHEFAAFLKAVQLSCRRNRLDYVRMSTARPIDLMLSEYLSSRMTRVK